MTPRTATYLTKPSIEPTMPLRAQPVTITVNLSPSFAATAAPTVIYGSRWEYKTVSKKVKGKKKYYRVWYWRARFALTLRMQPDGTVAVPTVLGKGSWRMQAKFPGTGMFLPAYSPTTYFTVR
jgi:hypothetical protein